MTEKKSKTAEMAERQAERFTQEVERTEGKVPESADRKSRIEAAVAMKIYGASYTTIAQELGYTDATRARDAVERALSSMTNSPDKIEHVRIILNKRMERLFSAVIKKALDPQAEEQLAYQRAALSIIDRQARLHGADAPQQTIIHTPDASRVEEWIGKMTAMANAETQEADIVDAEVVAEGEIE